MLKALLSSFFVMIAMIAIGYFMEKKGMTNKTVNKGLTDILIDVSLPFNMLASSQRLFVRETGQGIICTFVIACLYFPLALLCSKALAKMLKVPASKRGSFISSSVLMNTGFLGFPLAESLYGQEGVLCAIPFTLVVNFFLFGFCLRLFDENAKFSFKNVLSPAVIASTITMVVYFSQIKFPKPFADLCSSIGSLMTPLSMILIGTSLVGFNVKDIFSDLHAYETCLIRLVLYPLVIYGIMVVLGSRVPELSRRIAVLIGSLPAASMNVLLVQRYGGNIKFANSALILQMVFSVPMLMILLMLPY